MSRLKQHLEAQILNTTPVPELSPKLSCCDADLSVRHFADFIEFRVFTQLQVKQCVTHQFMQQANNAEDIVIHKLKQQILEEVFGEFRKPLHELRKAIWSYDMPKAYQLLQELESQMYD